MPTFWTEPMDFSKKRNRMGLTLMTRPLLRLMVTVTRWGTRKVTSCVLSCLQLPPALQRWMHELQTSQANTQSGCSKTSVWRLELRTLR